MDRVVNCQLSIRPCNIDAVNARNPLREAPDVFRTVSSRVIANKFEISMLASARTRRESGLLSVEDERRDSHLGRETTTTLWPPTLCALVHYAALTRVKSARSRYGACRSTLVDTSVANVRLISGRRKVKENIAEGNKKEKNSQGSVARISFARSSTYNVEENQETESRYRRYDLAERGIT